MIETFKKLERWTPKPETFDEMRAKRPIHFREGHMVGGPHQRHYEALMSPETGDEWCDFTLVTVTASLPEVSEIGLLRVWRKTLRYYNENHPDETVPYNFTANRGPDGNGLASAHVIFDVREMPDFHSLEHCWYKASALIGADWRLSKAGGRAALYWSENATEPHAIEEHYQQKWTREMLARAEEEAVERTPLPPIPPRKHQPAIITRRKGKEIKRQARPFWAEIFDNTPLIIDCTCPECVSNELPWITRANAAWAGWRDAKA